MIVDLSSAPPRDQLAVDLLRRAVDDDASLHGGGPVRFVVPERPVPVPAGVARAGDSGRFQG